MHYPEISASALREALNSETGQRLQKEWESAGTDSLLLRYAKNKDTTFPYKACILHFDLIKRAGNKIPVLLSKNPHWHIPAGINLEQATHEEVARYKARFVQAKSMLDLTGGLGIDFYHLSEGVEKAIYVDQNENLVETAKWNFQHRKNGVFVQQSAEEYIRETNTSFDLIYMDPARRDGVRKVFLPNDCSPNPVAIIPHLLTKSREVWLKLSPMIDLTALHRIWNDMAEIQLIARRNELKEILVKWQQQFAAPTRIHCVNILADQQVQEFTTHWDSSSAYQVPVGALDAFIYEPNAALMKSGVLAALCESFSMHALEKNTFILTSAEYKADFPGKIWKVKRSGKAGDRSMIHEEGMQIISRNFPSSADQIRKKYKIKEGQDQLLLACKTAEMGYCWILGTVQT